MLEIVIPQTVGWDEIREEFVHIDEQTLILEHSLLSISEWEMKTKKMYFSKKPKTTDENLLYIQCMTLNKHEVNPYVYNFLSNDNFNSIDNYINDSLTATTFNSFGNSNLINNHVVSSEEIYYWMFSLGIPIECERWPISRLLVLIRIFNIKNGGSKKMSKKDLNSKYAAINAQNKKLFSSKK